MERRFIKAAGLGSLAGFFVAGIAAAGLKGAPAPVVTLTEPVSNEAAASEQFVCADRFAEDENTAIAAEYGKVAVADCQFVGCGGAF